jgi:hypothetical protein
MSCDHLRRFWVEVRRHFYCAGILAANASMRDVEVESVAARSFVICVQRLGTDEIEEVASATFHE